MTEKNIEQRTRKNSNKKTIGKTKASRMQHSLDCEKVVTEETALGSLGMNPLTSSVMLLESAVPGADAEVEDMVLMVL